MKKKLKSKEINEDKILPLGYAKGQFHNTYIISETNDGIIVVDQHAASRENCLRKNKGVKFTKEN